MDDEILIDAKRDISNRKIHQSDLANFRGLIAQVTHVLEDKLRPIVWYGDEKNHYEEVLLKSDLQDGSQHLKIKGITLPLLTQTVNNGIYNPDLDKYKLFNLYLNQVTIVDIPNSDLTDNDSQEYTFIFTNLVNPSYPIFPTHILWTNQATPVFPTTTGARYLVRLYKTSTGWIGEYAASTGVNTNTGNISYSERHAKSEWLLPAGSVDGNDPEKITNNYFMDITEEEAQHMSDISQNIKDINKVAEKIENLSNLEDNLNTLNNLYSRITQLQSIAEKLDQVEALNGNLEEILQVANALSSIKLVAHHIKDKYFFDIKATQNKITGDTILKLDTAVLAPAEETVTTGSSGSGSSDSNYKLVWSDVEINDEDIPDGTIVVYPAKNNIGD